MTNYTKLFTDPITRHMIEEISQKLQETIYNRSDFLMLLNQTDVSGVLLKYPVVLLRQLNERAYWLIDLPEIYQANLFFMDEVIRFFIIKMECLLQEENRTAADMLQYLLTIIKDQTDYLNALPDAVSQHTWIAPLLTQHRDTIQSKKNESLINLSAMPNIPLSQLIRLTQHITPWEFISIIEDRQRNQLITLPFCNNPGLHAKFCQELPDADHWTTYLAYKRQFTPHASNTLAVKYLVETNAWFLAYMRFMHHHSYFNSRHDVEQNLQKIKMSLHKCFNFMIGFILPASGLVAVITFIIAPFFRFYPKQNSFSKALEICSNTISSGKNNSHMAYFMESCGNILQNIPVYAEKDFLTGYIENLIIKSKPEDLASSILICMYKLQSEENPNSLGLLASITVLVIIMMPAIFYFNSNPLFATHNLSFWDELKRFMYRLQGTCANTAVLLPANDLLTRCSDIIARLQGLDDPAAHQKSEVLTHLLDKVKTALPDTPTDAEIAQQLLEKRDIIPHRMSFFTIAAQRRCSDTFDLKQGNNTADNSKTSSIKHLIAPPYTALFKQNTLPEYITEKQIKLDKIA